MMAKFPFLGVMAHVASRLQSLAPGRGNVRDCLRAALVHKDVATWSELVYFMSEVGEWDVEEAFKSMQFIGSYIACVAANGRIDAENVAKMLRACDCMEDVKGYVGESDARTIGEADVMLRNWSVVMGAFHGRRLDIAGHMSAVPVPRDREILEHAFAPCVVKRRFHGDIFEASLKRVGLSVKTPGPRQLVEVVKDEVAKHYGGALAPVVQVSPVPPAPVVPLAVEPVPVPDPPKETEAEREERIAREFRARRAAEAAEAERRAAEAAVVVAPPAETQAVTTSPAEPIALSKPQIGIVRAINIALAVLVTERGWPCDRLPTGFMYKLVETVVMPGSKCGHMVSEIAEKGLYVRLTEAVRSKPSVFAINVAPTSESPFSKSEPRQFTDEEVRAFVGTYYPSDGVQLRRDIAFVTSVAKETLSPSRYAETAPAVAAPPVAESEPLAAEALPEQPVPAVPSPPPTPPPVAPDDRSALKTMLETAVREACAPLREEIASLRGTIASLATANADLRADIDRHVDERVRARLREVLPEEITALVEAALEASA